MSKISLIVTAGGTGSRFGVKNKLLEEVNNKTVIEHCIDKFTSIDEITEIVIPANVGIIDELTNIFANNKKIKIIEGGKNRQESVYKALQIVDKPDYVLIHDGARPMIKTTDVLKLIDKIKIDNAAILAVKTVDTIKLVRKGDKIVSTVDRSNLYNTQTPQGFEYNLIFNAHQKLKGEEYTDDSGMLEFLGEEVSIVEGDYTNFKITTALDLALMKTLLAD